MNHEPPELSMIDVERLVPTPDNPRVHREDQAFAELVESIKSVGILQPLIARAMTVEMELGSLTLPQGKQPKVGRGQLYDLRAGHRRLAAAKKAGLKTVPVMVREMDDKTAMEVTISENLQRENLHPLEEATGIQHLLDVGWEIEAIADRLGKKPAWVARRARLRELSDTWRKAIEDPKQPVAHWPANLLELVARLPEETQDVVLDRIDEEGMLPWTKNYQDGQQGLVPTTRELDRFIQGEILNTLGGAPFKLDDEVLVPEAGACTSCTKRAGCQPLLFEELEPTKKGKKAGGDRCLDQACYQAKAAAFAKQKLAELQAKHGNALAVTDRASAGIDEATKAAFGKVAQSWNYRPAKAKEKGAVPAVMVSSDRPGNVGQVAWVKPASSLPSSATFTNRKSASEPGKPTPLKERRKKLEAKRRSHFVRAVTEKLEKEDSQHLLEAMGEESLLVHIAAFGTNERHDRVYHNGDAPWTTAARLKKDRNELLAALMQSLTEVWHRRLRCLDSHTLKACAADAEQICACLGWSIDEFKAAAVEAIPEPKSWANLKADGTPKAPAKKRAAKKAAKPKAAGKRKKKVKAA